MPRCFAFIVAIALLTQSVAIGIGALADNISLRADGVASSPIVPSGIAKLSQEVLVSDAPEDEMNKVLFYGLPLNSMLGLTAEHIYTFNDMISYLNTTEGG